MRKRINDNMPLIIITGLAFVLLLNILPRVGALYTHDSVAYSYGAKSFLEGNGLRYFGYKTPIIQWPPLYILLLTIPVGLGLDLSKYMLIMNCLIYSLTLFIAGKWLINNLKSKWLPYIGMLFILFSVPMIHVSKYIWTEPLFILLLLVSIISFQKYINERSMKWLVTAAVLSALCWLTRYTGIVVLMTCGIILLIIIKPMRHKIRDIVIYGFIAASPMALWVIRNILLSKTITGGRTIKLTPIMDNIGKTLHIFYSWFAASDFKIGLMGMLLLVAIMITAITLLCVQKKVRKVLGDLNGGWMTFFVFTLFYAIVMIYSASKYAMDPLNDRLWSPIFIPIIFIVFFMIDRITWHLQLQHKILLNTVKVSVLVALILIVSYPIKYHIVGRKAIHLSMEGAAHSASIKKSETLWYIRNNNFSEDTIIFSNNPTILTYHTGIDSRWTPKKKGIDLYNYDSFNESIKNSEHLYIAWFGNRNSTIFYTIDDISKSNDVELVSQFADGVIYRIIK